MKTIEYFKVGDGEKLCALSYFPETNSFEGASMLLASNFSMDLPVPALRHIKYDNAQIDVAEFKQLFRAVKGWGKEIDKKEFDELLSKWIEGLNKDFYVD